ncbi:hypothetical protein PR048_009286 [Dryococelus australis]|uniref:Uncharacterized protein n=1 Tax=Dryococelus australis TaxID=614101 RepID=A0ABQ9HZF2_9NEOP|nr:hypothetical protein PR048_009286 [Dryococelus australis]
MAPQGRSGVGGANRPQRPRLGSRRLQQSCCSGDPQLCCLSNDAYPAEGTLLVMEEIERVGVVACEFDSLLIAPVCGNKYQIAAICVYSTERRVKYGVNHGRHPSMSQRFLITERARPGNISARGVKRPEKISKWKQGGPGTGRKSAPKRPAKSGDGRGKEEKAIRREKSWSFVREGGRCNPTPSQKSACPWPHRGFVVVARRRVWNTATSVHGCNHASVLGKSPMYATVVDVLVCIGVHRLRELPNNRLFKVESRETGYPRENPPTSGIVWHDSHLRKFGVNRPDIEPGSPWWEASMVTLLASQGEPGSIHGRFTPDFRKWESCRTTPLVGRFSRGYPVPLTLAFWSFSIPTLLHPHRPLKSRSNQHTGLGRGVDKLEHRWNVRMEEAEDPRENQPTSGIVTILSCGKFGSDPTGNRTRFVEMRGERSGHCAPQLHQYTGSTINSYVSTDCEHAGHIFRSEVRASTRGTLPAIAGILPTRRQHVRTASANERLVTHQLTAQLVGELLQHTAANQTQGTPVSRATSSQSENGYANIKGKATTFRLCKRQRYNFKMPKVKIPLPPPLNPHPSILSGDRGVDGGRRFVRCPSSVLLMPVRVVRPVLPDVPEFWYLYQLFCLKYQAVLPDRAVTMERCNVPNTSPGEVGDVPPSTGRKRRCTHKAPAPLDEHVRDIAPLLERGERAAALTVTLLAFHPGERRLFDSPRGRTRVYACVNRAAVYLQSGTVPYSPRFTLISSQDFDVKNRTGHIKMAPLPS